MYNVNDISILISQKETQRVRLILEHNPHLRHATTASNYSLLHSSADFNNFEIAQYLLDNGCPVDIQDDMGRTPMMIAAEAGNIKVAEILLYAGADVHVILNNRKMNVLQVVFERHSFPADFLVILLIEFRKQFSTSEETAEKLMDCGCHLYEAVCLQDVRIIEIMLDRGCLVHSMHPTFKETAFHYAVEFESVEIVRLLLKYGADSTASDVYRNTPLYYLQCCTLDGLEILKFFINSGIFMKCIFKSDIFQIANIWMHGHCEAIELVLQMYSNFKEKEKFSGKTMLHYLSKNKNLNVIEKLDVYVNKSNINTIDKRGRNPLYWASRVKNIDMVEFLLERGAVVDSTRYVINGNSTNNYPPLYYAYSIKSNVKSARFIELLLRYKHDAQFIITRNNGEDVTIFDITTTKNEFIRLKIVVAHLAIIERLGTPITEITRLKINSSPKLKRYFNRCRQMLQREVWGTVTVFKLLTDDDKKIASYLNQEELNLKLNRISYKRKLKSSFPYYYNTVRKRLSEGHSYKMLQNNAAKFFYNIFENRIHKNNCIVNYLMEFLNDHDLQTLYEV